MINEKIKKWVAIKMRDFSNGLVAGNLETEWKKLWFLDVRGTAKRQPTC